MSDDAPSNRDHRPGEKAPRLRDISRGGWNRIVRRVYRQIGEDQVVLLAAGVAFYGMLALIPALIAIITLWGLVSDPATVEQQIDSAAGILPPSVEGLIGEQMRDIVNRTEESTLTLGFILALAGTLWTTSSGMLGLIRAVNLAYQEDEDRNILKLRGLALMMTLGALLFIIVSLALVAVLPPVLKAVGLGSLVKTLITAVRWPALALMVVAALAAVYRFAPNRRDPQWRWVSLGALMATLLWLVGSYLFSLYVSNMGSYNETYGSLGTAIILLLWLFLTSFVVLLGAEINSQIEHHTLVDSTVGEDRPMGDRDAFVADTPPGRDHPITR